MFGTKGFFEARVIILLDRYEHLAGERQLRKGQQWPVSGHTFPTWAAAYCSGVHGVPYNVEPMLSQAPKADEVDSVLSRESVFQCEAIRRIYEDFMSGREPDIIPIWLFTVLELWMRGTWMVETGCGRRE